MSVHTIKRSLKATYTERVTASSIGDRSVQGRTMFLRVGGPGFYEVADQVSTVAVGLYRMAGGTL